MITNLVIIGLAIAAATAIAVSIAAIVVASRMAEILDDTATIVAIMIADQQRRIRRLKKRQIEQRFPRLPERPPVVRRYPQ
jgi:hypothetical protein